MRSTRFKGGPDDFRLEPTLNRYIARRLLWLIVVVLCVSVITFALTFVVPTDPAATIVGPKPTPEILAQARRELEIGRASCRERV